MSEIFKKIPRGVRASLKRKFASHLEAHLIGDGGAGKIVFSSRLSTFEWTIEVSAFLCIEPGTLFHANHF